MPMVSAPPGRLSTMTDWPRNLAISGAIRRAMLSVALPAACGTTKRIGRSGNCAATGCAAPRASTKTTSNFRLRIQLGADLAAFVRCAVHVDVEAAGLECRHLRRVQLGIGGPAVRVAVLGQGHDHRAVRALGALVNVRHGAF